MKFNRWAKSLNLREKQRNAINSLKDQTKLWITKLWYDTKPLRTYWLAKKQRVNICLYSSSNVLI